MRTSLGITCSRSQSAPNFSATAESKPAFVAIARVASSERDYLLKIHNWEEGERRVGLGKANFTIISHLCEGPVAFTQKLSKLDGKFRSKSPAQVKLN